MPAVSRWCSSSPPGSERVDAVGDGAALSSDLPLGYSGETLGRRVWIRPSSPSSTAADAEQFIEEVRGDDPEVAAKLRIEERELETDSPN